MQTTKKPRDIWLGAMGFSLLTFIVAIVFNKPDPTALNSSLLAAAFAFAVGFAGLRWLA